jgi:hypothetical protein
MATAAVSTTSRAALRVATAAAACCACIMFGAASVGDRTGPVGALGKHPAVGNAPDLDNEVRQSNDLCNTHPKRCKELCLAFHRALHSAASENALLCAGNHKGTSCQE